MFVIFQENHSFDNYFGTYPGAENLSTPLAQAHGFRQFDSIGNTWVTPFRITDPDVESLSQSRPVLLQKINGGKMDGFVSAQEAVSRKRLGDAAARAMGLQTMAHYDCDTVPFLWKYAHAFVLFDHIFQAIISPSTPKNIAAIAAQAGQSQGARDPSATSTVTGAGVPVLDDLDPAFGPYADTSQIFQVSQAYATLPLMLNGTANAQVTQNTAGVERDLGALIALGHPPVPWGWYQEGYVSPIAHCPVTKRITMRRNTSAICAITTFSGSTCTQCSDA